MESIEHRIQLGQFGLRVLPDPLFEAAERLAKRQGKSRSQLYISGEASGD